MISRPPKKKGTRAKKAMYRIRIHSGQIRGILTRKMETPPQIPQRTSPEIHDCFDAR
jgi:hypothetical protein